MCRLALYAVGCPPLVCFLEISALTGGSAPRTPRHLFPRPDAGRGAVSHRRYRHIRPSGRLLHGARQTRTALVARQVPVPVPPRLHGRAGTAGTIARIAGENDPHGFPTCPTAFRDLRGLCFETLTDCPRSNRKIRISPCPIPRSHVGIPVTGTASVSDSRRYSGTLALQTAAYNSQRNILHSNANPGRVAGSKHMWIGASVRSRFE